MTTPNYLKTDVTLVDPADGAVVSKSGFTLAPFTNPLGVITFADGTKQATAAQSSISELSAALAIPAESVTLVAGVIDGPPNNTALAPPISKGGSYIFTISASLGGNGTTWSTTNEVIVAKFVITVKSSGGTPSLTAGWTQTLTQSFGNSATAVFNAETRLRLPAPPLGETWASIDAVMSAGSNVGTSTSTIGMSAKDVRVWQT